MKQSLSLNLKQKLLMTPKLQQSINILQLSSYELNKLIEKEYMENPALEMDLGSSEELEPIYTFDKVTELVEYLNKDDEKPEPVAIDDNYKVKEISQNYQSLEEVLLEQLNFSFNDIKQINIAKYIIGLLDQNGYLRMDLKEIAVLVNVDVNLIEEVLLKIQTFEPTGVAARNLQECLKIQAEKDNVYEDLVKIIIDKYLNQVAEGKIKEIALIEKREPFEVQKAVDTIRGFNPKPGSSYGKANPQYIIPDVVVRDINGKLEVIVNDSGMLHLHVNKLCSQRNLLDADSRKYIEQHVNSAIWLIKSIEQRRQTLLKVVNEIVKQQEDVFRKGFAYMKPLLMKTVAENIGVHESTVSRTVANKYMEMPYGIVALKKFFAINVSKKDGEETIIADKVKALIRDFIEKEDKLKPLSDQQIANLLQADKNMKISRRTVMKYREQMGYPSSAKRKRY